MRIIVFITSTIIIFYNNILYANSTSHIISHTSYLADSPIVIQSLQSNDTLENTTRAFRLNYSKSMFAPTVTLGWQINLPIPVSEPIYVGEPDFHFPDRWPWTHHASSPSENNISAQKYSHFQKSNSPRTPSIYQIDGQSILHGFDLKTGQSLVHIDLSELLAVKLSSNLSIETTVEPQITISDAFINNSWHTLLVAVVGDKRQTIFCLDITYPNLLTAKAAKAQLLWQKTDSRGYFSRPTLIRTIDGDWSLLFAQECCKADGFVTGIIKVYSLKSGLEKADMSLPAFRVDATQNIYLDQNVAPAKRKNIDILECQNRIQFTKLSPIDSRSRGYVDYLYLGDSLGTIWKLDMTTKTPKDWGLFKQSNGNAQSRIGVFSMIENNQYGQILSQPKIISHPNGQGVLIGFLAKSLNNQYNYMVCIFENGHNTFLLSDMHDSVTSQSENWYINTQNLQSSLVVRNGRVLTVLSGNNAAVLDMKDGKVYAQSPYRLVRNTSYADDFSDISNFVGNPLIFQRGASDPNFVLHALRNGDFAWAEIDIESDRMGRRVWRELNE